MRRFALTFIALVTVSVAVPAETGCTPQARRDAAVIGLDVMQCVLANQGETDADVYAKCARENVTKEDVLKMLAEARAATAKAAKAGDCK